MTQEEKQTAIKEFTEQAAHNALVFFKMLGLETHIETMIINGDEQYVLRFQKVVDGKIFNGETNSFLYTKEQVVGLIIADRKDAAEEVNSNTYYDVLGYDGFESIKEAILNRDLPNELSNLK